MARLNDVAREETSEARQIANEFSSALARDSRVDGVLLFGSVARGSEHGLSDVDLLIVGNDPAVTVRSLMSVSQQRTRGRLSIQYYSIGRVTQLFETASSFTDHLRSEGRILLDRRGILRDLLGSQPKARISIEEELSSELRRLEFLEDLEQFRDNFLFCLSRLYGVGRSVVKLALMRVGVSEFDQLRAFDSYADSRPDLAHEIGLVRSLRPFQLLVTERGVEPLPFPYRGVQDEVSAAIAAIRRLAS